MARSELADEVNRYLFSTTHKRYELDRHQIARYERGEVRWPGAAYRAGLRAVLGAKTDDELGFTPRKRAVGRTVLNGVGEVPSGWHPAEVLATAEEMTGEDVALSRRQALGAASATAGAAITEPLQRWLAPAHGRFPGASAISGTELVGWQQIARQFHDWNKTPTGGLARKAVLAQLNELSDRLKDVSEAPTTRPAYLVGADLAEIAASMSWDAGLHRAAQRYYSLSVKFAKVAGDDTFAALTLASFARQCFDVRQPDDGLELVQLAQYGARKSAGPRLRSLLATREAWSYAQTGEVQPFRRAAGLAEDHFAEEPNGTDEPIGGLDQAELFGVLGARWRDLAVSSEQAKQARHAQDYIGRALALRDPASVRNRAFDLIGLARTHLVTAEPDYACELIETALPIAADWASGRVGAKLRDFYQESQRFGRSPRVRATRDAVRDVVIT
ncbi:hypothetical protein BJ969_004078 [Saccharopolyspora gloriosae]|uniref:Regulatory protein n=1 Tax=Saccharopolyspora gloriosae TaxID=455344 RepID=A0A840NGG2_9PSEU|nr:hypothetical protein [Saccharopolyspora gloriosae]MBB5070990.1 hypothetical protein [Saccharopolyspora gloriosae]